MNVKPNSTPCAMLALGMGLCLPLVGAAQRSVRTQPAPDEAVVYYLDGAGGGGLVVNWDRAIRQGVERGGFAGDFRNHNWQMGMGPLIDDTMSARRKREAARELAAEIVQRMDRRPTTPDRPLAPESAGHPAGSARTSDRDPARADGRWPWRGSAPVDAASGQVPDPL